MVEATTEIISQVSDKGVVMITMFMTVFSWFISFIYSGAWFFATNDTSTFIRNLISWNTIDVLSASLLVTCLELDGIANTIAENACNFPCFSAHTNIGPGIWYLIISSLFIWIAEIISRYSWTYKRRRSLQELPNYAELGEGTIN